MTRIAAALVSLSLLAACSAGTPADAPSAPAFDEAQALADIESTRNAFMSAVREQRWQDLGQVVTQDLVAVYPASPEWQDLVALAQARGVPFAYDSIVMAPMETVVVSESIAWDMGVSTVYYTSAEGESRVVGDTYLAILKKGEDGVWRLHREVASASVQ